MVEEIIKSCKRLRLNLPPIEVKEMRPHELGQAFKDHIEINKNIQDRELLARTILHEYKHWLQLKSELSWDHSNLYWKGDAYPMVLREASDRFFILYNDKWTKEGSEEFPWEQECYQYEEKMINEVLRPHDRWGWLKKIYRWLFHSYGVRQVN